jgi:hypothetical protein
MKAGSRALAAASWLSLLLFITNPAIAQKSGGILKISHFDSPASMSLLEESTAAALRPVMGVFNNLVVYDQHVAQNSMRSIVPEGIVTETRSEASGVSDRMSVWARSATAAIASRPRSSSTRSGSISASP